MCDAETRQELILRGATPTWERCLEIANGKTGSLFAYVAGACGGPDPECRAACEASGYDVGTAYQIADDLLDATGNEALSGKTLGTDDARGKITAVTALAPGNPDPVAFIENLLAESTSRLAPWPAVQAAWTELLETEIRPAMSTYTDAYRASS